MDARPFGKSIKEQTRNSQTTHSWEQETQPRKVHHMNGKLSQRFMNWLMLLLEVNFIFLIKTYVYLIGAQFLNLNPELDAEDKKWKFMGIFGKNREEWTVVDLASMRSSTTIVPFFDSLGSDALAFVIN
jgi:hypothetical protein